MHNILELDENLKGVDYIIGDVHGSLVFEDVIALLKPNDRLFIVGDLFDRGVANSEVYASIKSLEKQIFVVKGNHEEMLLAAMKPIADDITITNFLRNGGIWILEDKNIQHKMTAYVEAVNKVLQQADIPKEIKQDWVQKAIKIIGEKFKIASKIPDIDQIVNYVATLPYIIRVGKENTNPFIICHADMPFSDDRLDEMVQNQTDDFSPAEIQHITWARQKDRNLIKERNPSSILVYCGHSPLLTAEDTIRVDTNHINLDSGAYVGSTTLVVDHTNSNAFIIENKKATLNRTAPAISYLLMLNEAKEKINQHLKRLEKTAEKKLNDISDGKDIDKWFTDQLIGYNKLQHPQKYLTLLKAIIQKESSPLTEDKKQQLKNFLNTNKDHMLYDNPRNINTVIEVLDGFDRKRKFTP